MYYVFVSETSRENKRLGKIRNVLTIIILHGLISKTLKLFAKN